jgi:hypothetical protein
LVNDVNKFEQEFFKYSISFNLIENKLNIKKRFFKLQTQLPLPQDTEQGEYSSLQI